MKQYKTLLLLLISAVLFANDNLEKKKKVIEKSFTVNNDAVLEVTNKYGNINISTWNQNTCKIHVEITVEGNNESKLNERLNSVSVGIEGSKSKVTAHTSLGSKNSWCNDTKVKVNYDIKIPKTNHIYLTNDYGNIVIDELDGRSNIDLDYGNIKIGTLNNTSNNIVLDYANNSSIEFANEANIDCDYGKITLDEVRKLNWDSDYTDLNLGEVSNFNYVMDYGSLKVGSAVRVVGDIDYTGQSFGKISKSLSLVTDYGSISIGELENGFESVTVDSDYASVKIGVDSNTGYSLVADTSYGSVHAPDNFKTKEKIKKNHKTYLKGTAGNGKGKITVSSDYGSVKIKNQ